MNPFSNVSQLLIRDIQPDDHTVIYNIPLPNMVLNDIFMDDHEHFWSISEELSRVTPEKNPLTNLPFEPAEWERIVKAREWMQKMKDPPPPAQPPLPLMMNHPLPTRSPPPPPPRSSWICCSRGCSTTRGNERYTLYCDYCSLSVNRAGGEFPGKCIMFPPCVCYEDDGDSSVCAPLCCLYCFNADSCLYRTNKSGFICPLGWSFITRESQIDYSSFMFLFHCFSRKDPQRSYIFTPCICYHQSDSYNWFLTPLCAEFGDIFLSPMMCWNSKLCCCFGIPVVRLQ
jgi:hypothetical protein